MVPAQVGGLPRAKAIAAGSGHSFIIEEQFGNVWAWGQNTFGQVGTGTATSTPVLVPTPVNGVFAATAVIAGHHNSLVIQGNGLARAWGQNSSGQLGAGHTTNSASPVNVTGLTDATALAAGAQHALALRPGCPVWAWGHNGQGQLGTGTVATTPVTAPGASGLVNTFYFDGDLDGFGDEYISEQACEPLPGFVEDVDGDGFGDASRPIQGCQSPTQSCQQRMAYVSSAGDCNDSNAGVRPGATEVCDAVDNNCNGSTDEAACAGHRVAPGVTHTVALKRDGTVWAWGHNGYGQLGDGTAFNRSAPVRVQGLTGVTAIAAGDSHTVALMADGTVWAWGLNGWNNVYDDDGTLLWQLGTGTGNPSTFITDTPKKVPSPTNVAAIFVGGSSTFAVRRDGSIWAWGQNTSGQLGDGTASNRSTAVQVQGWSH